MRWDNIPKEQRREQWHIAAAPQLINLASAAHWCRVHSSTGRFYNHYTNTRWWFEFESDALLFTLKWSGHERPEAWEYSEGIVMKRPASISVL